MQMLSVDYANESRLITVDAGRNLGNPGALNIAIKQALSDPHTDWIWILDDDAWPDTNALKRLTEGSLETLTIYAPLVLEKAGGEISFPMLTVKPRLFVRTLAELPTQNELRVSGAWLGTMIPRNAIDRIGEVNAQLFIRGEDEDYPRRLALAGFNFVCRRNAILYHPKMKIVSIRFLGTGFGYEPGLALWKSYYQFRNKVYVVRTTTRHRWLGAAKGLIIGIGYLAAILILDDHKIKRLLIWPTAMKDALSGNLRNPDFSPAGRNSA
jgi:GT2 family glycosyltransferase